jgi:hypothetical protein
MFAAALMAAPPKRLGVEIFYRCWIGTSYHAVQIFSHCVQSFLLFLNVSPESLRALAKQSTDGRGLLRKGSQ